MPDASVLLAQFMSLVVEWDEARLQTRLWTQRGEPAPVWLTERIDSLWAQIVEVGSQLGWSANTFTCNVYKVLGGYC